MQALLAVLLLVGIGAGVAAYHGMFYVTGSQFYEACQQRQAKEKIVGGFNEVEADNPSQAALWGSCTPIMTESMENAGFAIGSSLPQGDAPDFVEVGEAGIAMDDAMRRQRRVQLVG